MNTKPKIKRVKLLGARCRLEFGYYNNKTIAILAYTEKDDEQWCVPTVNYEQHFEGRNYKKEMKFPKIVIKNYNAQAGIYEELQRQNVIQQGPYLSGSAGGVQIGILTKEWQKIAQLQLKLKK